MKGKRHKTVVEAAMWFRDSDSEKISYEDIQVLFGSDNGV